MYVHYLKLGMPMRHRILLQLAFIDDHIYYYATRTMVTFWDLFKDNGVNLSDLPEPLTHRCTVPQKVQSNL